MKKKEAKEIARARMGDKRFNHTINVKKMAVSLAEHYGEDPDRAAVAALLHDSAKEMPTEQQIELMLKYPQYAEGGSRRPAPVWHGICAAILARTEWGVTDEGILSAIACHTTGKPGMSRLDKIIYLADMTSAERDWEGVEELRQLCFESLDRAMLAALQQTMSFVRKCGKPADPVSLDAFEDILHTSGLRREDFER